jgi:hypothetical protein
MYVYEHLLDVHTHTHTHTHTNTHTHTQVHIQYNCIAVPLSPTFGALTNLQQLYAHDNKMQSIPKEMSYLASLVHLDLSYNDILEIPPLRGMASLKFVDLRFTCFTQILVYLLSLHNFAKTKYPVLRHRLYLLYLLYGPHAQLPHR